MSTVEKPKLGDHFDRWAEWVLDPTIPELEGQCRAVHAIETFKPLGPVAMSGLFRAISDRGAEQDPDLFLNTCPSCLSEWWGDAPATVSKWRSLCGSCLQGEM
jgi:hypothetical protein